MDGINGPRGNNFDPDFCKAGVAHNTQKSNAWFLQQRAEWQVTRLAVVHGMYSGALYGGAAGLVMAIRRRQMRYIPYGAMALGIPYSIGLAWSTLYRMDV